MATQLVLLPGLDGTGILFRPFMAALPRGLTATPVSYPGDRPLGYPELLELVLAALPKQEPFVLLGESFSGPLAILAAASAPPGLRALILCATFVRSPFPCVPASCAGMLGRALYGLPLSLKARVLLDGYRSPELLSLLQAAHDGVAPEVYAHRMQSIAAVDVRRELQSVRVPALYIRPTRDVIVPYWNASQIKSALPEMALARIRAPHLVLQTEPARAHEVIARFIQDHCDLSI